VISVGVIDDHPVSRWGIQRALEAAPDIRVAGMYASPDRLTADVDVVVLDLFLADDLPCLAAVRGMAQRTAVLMISASRRSADIQACFRVGARGYVHKSIEPDALAAAVRTVASGGTVAPTPDEARSAPAGPSVLSRRECQVLHFIANGYTHDQAARRLGISRHTVDTYVKRLRTKLGDGNKAHLTRAALLAGAARWRGQEALG
jgi:DNA-binding NarL/FixJ family response regulator